MRMKKLLVCVLMCSIIMTSLGVNVAQAAESKKTKSTSETVTEKTDNKEDTKKNKKTKKNTKKGSKKAYTQSQLRMMSCIIFCEAGIEPYAGKQAVGIVIMNRIASKDFPDTLKKVIYQPYQFGPVRNGMLSKALKRWDAGDFDSKYDKACIKAAKYALEGNKTVTYKGKEINMKKYKFFSGYVSNHKLEIGGHQFK